MLSDLVGTAPPKIISGGRTDKATRNFEFNKVIYLQMIDHVFLPRRLPTEFNAKHNDQLDEVETSLLALMCDVLKEFDSSQIPETVRQIFTSMHSMHCVLKIRPSKILSAQLRILQPKKMMGVHVRAANCGILMMRSENRSEITVATFTPNLKNEQIYGTADQIKGDIQVDYPTRAVKLKFSDLLQSEYFAEQICHLKKKSYNRMTGDNNEDEAGSDVDVSTPDHVTQWLIGAASNRSSCTTKFPVISKKMRDEPGQGFRRSGLWITMKVLLQLGLTIAHDSNSKGIHMYKLVMLKFMGKMCTYLTYSYTDTTKNDSFDTAVEMLAKIGRRIHKLANCGNASADVLTSSIINEAKARIVKVRCFLDRFHAEMQSKEELITTLSTGEQLHFDKHIIHNLSDFEKYLKDRTTFRLVNGKKTKEVDRGDVPIFNPETKPDIDEMENLSTANEQLRYLNHVENWVQSCLRTGKGQDATVLYLRTLAIQYINKAVLFYKNDPVGYSRMVVTMLIIIQTLDTAACRKSKLFSSHHSGIKSQLFDKLLLTSSHELKVLLDLQQYFEGRNAEADKPGLLGEDEISENSFSVRYAETDRDMITTKDAIQQKDEKRKKEKEDEVSKARDDDKELRKDSTCPDFGPCVCEKCKKRKKADALRVSVYRTIVMRKEYQQNALVFELRIPDVFACLRDVLYAFVSKHYKQLTDWEKCFSWREHPDLKEYVKGSATCVIFGTSQFGRNSRLHPNREMNAFIVSKNYDFLMCGKSGQKWTKMPTATNDQSLQRYVTFSVEKSSVYETLQWTLDSTDHTQNRVLVTKNECAANLPMAEYIEFGSLRADGYQLQYYNLYRAICTESLSFETPSVLALIGQALWEAGPKMGTVTKAWHRKSNKPFRNLEFVQAMLALLESYIERQRRNWRHSLKLTVATLIVCRMFEINAEASVADGSIRNLLRFRLIAIGWIADIEEAICKGDMSEADRLELYAIVTNVAICGAFTFFVNRHHEHFDKIFGSTGGYSAVKSWLIFVKTIGHYNPLCKANPQRDTQELLLRMAYTIGLDIEIKMGKLIENSPEEVKEFVRERYVDSREGTLDGIHLSQRHTVGLFAVIDKQRINIEIDYVFGNFLIDGLPMSRLPDCITTHSTFRRIFGTTTFEVHPRRQVFSTVLPFKGYFYNFREHKDDGIIVQERDEQSRKCIKQLIPHTKLSGIVPHLLVENFSHWYNVNRNRVEFRPKSFSDENFATAEGIQYELDLTTGCLKHIKSERLLLDVCSSSFQHIAVLLRRLERADYIHVLMDAPLKARVELVRMNLSFVIDCSEKQSEYHIESREFSGMRVSLKQGIGTLFGLRFGLWLESTDESIKNRLLVVPHSEFNVKQSDLHVEVETIAKDGCLRSPSFFEYRVHNECHVLKASNYAAWFYLAHLHAVTSYPLPDPFTGMTGVERALQILQLGLAWSSEPYDKESMCTLQSLADLSPIRQFQANTQLAVTKWPAGVRHHAAQDAFVIVVQELIKSSMRLSILYPSENKRPSLKTVSNIELNARSYARHVPYATNCKISESFTQQYDNGITHFIAKEEADTVTNLKHIRELAAHYDERGFHVPSDDVAGMIFDLFQSEPTLVGCGIGSQNDKPRSSIIDYCCSSSFPNLWLHLYERIRASAHLSLDEQKCEYQWFHLILTLLASNGEDLRQLQILQAIAAKPREFFGCQAPQYDSYTNVNCYEFDPTAIEEAIDGATITLEKVLESERSKYTEIEWIEMGPKLETKYHSEIKIIKQHLTEEIWLCKSVDTPSIQTRSKLLNMDRAYNEISQLLQSWHKNIELRRFTHEIGKIFENKLRPLSSRSVIDQPEWTCCAADALIFPKHAIDFEAKMCSNYGQHADDIAVARGIYENGDEGKLPLEQCWDQFRRISTPPSEAYLVDAQLYPRMVPTTILPRILPARHNDPPRNVEQQILIGALAVMTCQEQRARRFDRYKQQPQMEVAWQREKDNPLFESWRPHEHPEWLLLQIELNLAIRTMQVEIAERMIEPPDNKHTVMQLNMGEGKTSVIVPMVAAELANGKQLCTVTVLRQLFQSNLRSLRQCVGGLLQRRVYTMPCRRDMDIGSLTKDIQCIYEECMKERGILLTLPEYRLSLQLKIYEAACKVKESKSKDGEGEEGKGIEGKDMDGEDMDGKGDKNTETAWELLQIHNWLNANSRHILDESDALLQPNYAVIYTAGAQLPPDGNSLRWTCVQALLKRVPFHMRRLYVEAGDQKIEFCETYTCDGVDYGSGDVGNRPEVFRPCRLLDPDMYDRLSDALADDFVNGITAIQFPEMNEQMRKRVRNVLVDKKFAKKDLDECLDHFDTVPRQTILILSGLLKFEVLRLALAKRWRVNYGRNPLGPRKMAVPFKAKDVAAEMTEFGHPDVAICLTHLAYYYAGLSDDELHETFRRLDRSENPNEIYDEWIDAVPECARHESIKSYSGVNLSDVKQRTKYLFPVLRRNMYVIDFWLSEEVFPREAKLFEQKLVSTAWDLCTERLVHPVTGFSGTNDMKALLPLAVIQNDLPELEGTNEKVREILLNPENDRYLALPSNTSGMDILRQLKTKNIPVLLDAGALMLELNNEQVAREWLKLMPIDRYDAAIYFSEKDIMLTVDRNGSIDEFEQSVYREQLGRCVTYLDDVHTRGTDLQFPRGIQACVTLCGGITRDKTVQACMRMRMLSEGHHNIAFWASHEADVGIRKLKADATGLNTTDVINYVTENCHKFENDNISHWLNAALNYAKKTAAHDLIKIRENSTTKELMKELGQRCRDEENIDLKDLYGAKQVEQLITVADTTFTKLRKPYCNDDDIFDWILNTIESPVRNRLRNRFRDVEKITQILDEQCEKELEYELEQNQEVHRPQMLVPAKPQFNPLLKKFCGQVDGRWKVFKQLIDAGAIEKLPLAFQNTLLFSAIQNQLNAFAQNLWATRDFRLVVEASADVKDDEYLRPVWWIIRIDADAQQQQKQDTYILISPHECNKLISTFRTKITSNATLHMFSVKLSQLQDNLINNKALQIPSRQTSPTIQMNALAQLSWFAGSMYFTNAEEYSAYCNFVGYIPQPRTKKQQERFDVGRILANGYVRKRHRDDFPELDDCHFEEDPAKITREIIERRHGFLGKRSHVGLLIHEAKRPKFDDNQMQTD